VARKLSGLSRDQVSYLRALGSMTVRLMQAATNPMLLGNEDEYFNELLDISSRSPLWEAIFDYSKYEKPAKFVFLETFIQNYLNKDANNKIVLWTYFIKNIKLLEKILQKYNPTSIYGAINTGSIEDFDSRESRIRKFHIDPDCRLLIANPQACGEGISLHKACHHAIYLDRNFNAAYYLQSVDRIHRLGLGKDIDTQITILIAKDTIDEIIVKRLNEKTVRMAEVLNDQFLRKLAFDPEDIEIDEALGLDSQDVQDVIHHIGI
jgi:SNF2 family DNA or RNA helicase